MGCTEEDPGCVCLGIGKGGITPALSCYMFSGGYSPAHSHRLLFTSFASAPFAPNIIAIARNMKIKTEITHAMRSLRIQNGRKTTIIIAFMVYGFMLVKIKFVNGTFVVFLRANASVMEKIVIPDLCSVSSDDLRHFVVKVSRINACCHHARLTKEDHMKLKVAMMQAVKEFCSTLEYNEQSLYIPQSHRTFDEDDLKLFYQNMWSHKRRWYHAFLSWLLPRRLYKSLSPYILD